MTNCENIDGQCAESWCDCDYQRRKRQLSSIQKMTPKKDTWFRTVNGEYAFVDGRYDVISTPYKWVGYVLFQPTKMAVAWDDDGKMLEGHACKHDLKDEIGPILCGYGCLPSHADSIIADLESRGLGWSLDHTGHLIEARIWKWPSVIGRYRPESTEPLAQMLERALAEVDLKEYPVRAANSP